MSLFIGHGVTQTETNLLKIENNLDAKMRNILDAELQKMREQQSQSFKNHNIKVTNEYTNLKTTLDKQINAIKDDHGHKLSKIEQIVDEMNDKFNSNMNDIKTKTIVDKSSMKGTENNFDIYF